MTIFKDLARSAILSYLRVRAEAASSRHKLPTANELTFLADRHGLQMQDWLVTLAQLIEDGIVLQDGPWLTLSDIGFPDVD